MTPRLRILLGVLMATIMGVTLLVVAIQIWGNPIGEPCIDSYSCKGFLVSGAECLATDTEQYCSRYCDGDSDCPTQWTCANANPTVLTVETAMLDTICVRQ